MESPSLNLIFKYALCFDGFKAFGGIEALANIANERLAEYHWSNRWLGSAREMRACLFFEERRWRHFGWPPDGDDLKPIESLFQTILDQLRDGDSAPNDPPSLDVLGCPSVLVDGERARLLGWKSEDGLFLTIALDDTGNIAQRICPPSTITPDDPAILEPIRWLFNPHKKSEDRPER